MSHIALSYEIPFVDQVTMPARWARWLASQGGRPNLKIKEAAEANGTITWRYQEHGPLPWMQFFYDWRFADIDGMAKSTMRRVINSTKEEKTKWKLRL